VRYIGIDTPEIHPKVDKGLLMLKPILPTPNTRTTWKSWSKKPDKLAKVCGQNKGGTSG